MLGTYTAIAAVSFILGIGAKYADLVNEHGLKERFKGVGMLAGFVWGLAGIGMVYLSPLGGLTYIAHILYWFRKVKLEFSNHALAGVMMVLGGFYFQGEFYHQHRIELVAVYLAYLLTGHVQTYFKQNYPATRKFWRLRLRIYLVPIAYSLYHGSIEPMLCTGFGMIACELMNVIYREYQADVVDRFGRPIGAGAADVPR